MSSVAARALATLASFSLLACGDPGEEALDGPPAPPDAAPSPSCADPRFSRTEGEVTDAALGFVEGLHAIGATDAYLSWPPEGTQSVLYVHAMNVDLEVAADADPAPVILAWLATAAGSPVRPEEYGPDPDLPFDPTMPAGEGGTLNLLRVRIEDVPFPGSAGGVPGLSLVLEKNAAGYRVLAASLWPQVLFATRADAELQVACTPAEPPPEEPLRVYTFEGLELTQCGVDGAYQYTPDAADDIVWLDDVSWPGTRLLDDDPAARSVWVPTRGAWLVIDPANYWDRIAHADCYCPGSIGGDAGFTITAHALTGELIRWFPAINCVVC